jgi:hypothetical protein
LEGKWSKRAYRAFCLLPLYSIAFFVSYIATTRSMPRNLSRQHLYLVVLGVDQKQIGAAAFTAVLLIPVLGAIPMALMQPPFEDFVFIGLAVITLVSDFRDLYLLFPLMIAN